jgi:hypothetical protein
MAAAAMALVAIVCRNPDNARALRERGSLPIVVRSVQMTDADDKPLRVASCLALATLGRADPLASRVVREARGVDVLTFAATRDPLFGHAALAVCTLAEHDASFRDGAAAALSEALKPHERDVVAGQAISALVTLASSDVNHENRVAVTSRLISYLQPPKTDAGTVMLGMVKPMGLSKISS